MKEFSPLNTFARSTFFLQEMGTINFSHLEFSILFLVTPFDLKKSLWQMSYILSRKAILPGRLATLAACSQDSPMRTTVLRNERFLSIFCLQINKKQ